MGFFSCLKLTEWNNKIKVCSQWLMFSNVSLMSLKIHCWHTFLWFHIPDHWFLLKMVGYKKKVKCHIKQDDPNTRWKRCQCLCYITTTDPWRLYLHDAYENGLIHWTVICDELTALNNDDTRKANNVRARSAVSGAELGFIWWHLLWQFGWEC